MPISLRINIDTINLKTSLFFIIAFYWYLLDNGNVKKDNNINQFVLLVRKKSYSLFINNQNKFLEYLDIINLKTESIE